MLSASRYFLMKEVKFLDGDKFISGIDFNGEKRLTGENTVSAFQTVESFSLPPDGTFFILILGVLVIPLSIFRAFRQELVIGRFSFKGLEPGDLLPGDSVMIDLNLLGDRPTSLHALLFSLGMYILLNFDCFGVVYFVSTASLVLDIW